MADELERAIEQAIEQARQAAQRPREALTPFGEGWQLDSDGSVVYLLDGKTAMQTPDLAEIMRKAYGAHGQPPAPKPASLVDGVARLLGTSESVARDWLIAKVSAFRGESEATTAARLAGEEGTI